MRCFRKTGASEAKQNKEGKGSGEEVEVRVEAGKSEQCTSTVKKKGSGQKSYVVSLRPFWIFT